MEATILKCLYCKKSFKSSFCRRRHIEKCRDKPIGPKACLICHLCGYLSSHSKLTVHYENMHNLQIEKETFLFENQTDFMQFKQAKESETGMSFKLINPMKLTKNGNSTNKSYYCNRCHDNSYPVIKTSCPAKIKTTILNSGQILVEFVSTHFGHTLEPKVLPSLQISSGTKNSKIKREHNDSDDDGIVDAWAAKKYDMKNIVIDIVPQKAEDENDLEKNIASMKNLFGIVSKFVKTVKDVNIVNESLHSCLLQLTDES